MNTRNSGPDFQLKADTALVILEDGSGRLLDLDGRFYGLSATAATMLQGTLEHGIVHAAARMAVRFRHDRQDLEMDMREFLNGLARAQLVVRDGGPGHLPVAQCSRPLLVLVWALHRLVPRGRIQCWLMLACAYVAIRLINWPRTLATWKMAHRSLDGAATQQGQTATIPGCVAEVTAGHLLPVECKERSLTCWSLLRTSGVPARLVVGVDFFPFASHCWCEVDGQVVGDFADRCQKYRPVFSYE